MNRMKAIVQDRYGNADVLQFRDIDQPTPGTGEVLIQVHAAALNRGTLHLMTGEPYLLRLGFGVRKPKNPVPGQDVAGTVVATGPHVTRFSVGDEVFGIAQGSFAEYTVAREEKLAHKPARITFEQAAAMPISGMTALRALDAADVEAGQTVLVVGASGGSRTFDAIVDIGGMTPIERLRRTLTRTGTLVIVGGEGDARCSPGLGRQMHAILLSPFVTQRLTTVMNKEHYSGLDRLAVLATEGDMASFMDRPYPLTEAADAVRHLAAGKAAGKVVITV